MHEFHAWIGLAESPEESDLGGLAGEFYHFANSIRDELIPTFARALAPGSQIINDK